MSLLGYKEREMISKTKAIELMVSQLVSPARGPYRSYNAGLFINTNNIINERENIPKAAGVL
jgi:hypothetical protein